MVTNRNIRRFLDLPLADREFFVEKVDTVSRNKEALMFINKLGMDLRKLDTSEDCIFLLDDRYEEFHSSRNDFIRVSNPKYLFCLIVEAFDLPSRLQLDFHRLDHFTATDYCRECLIGMNCQIDPGAIVGGTDFSPVMGENRDKLVQFPQMGGVMIGDNVVIKYNTMIGKGTFGFTEIGDNTMIDYGCQIGHNCVIGKSCIIAAGTIIGGSTKVGDNTTIGIGAKIRNGLTIGNNVSIGMGSIVIKDIPDNTVVIGNPARIVEHKSIFDERGLV